MKKLLMFILFFTIVINGFGQKWRASGVGVGLIVVDENYDKRLNIAQKGDTWDIKELYENGALAGRHNGNQLFAAWIEGPHTKEFLNQNGVAIWLYKYKITYPDGKNFESGPHGFYTPGFTYFGINPGSYTNGKWKIEWFIWNRDTQETRQAGAYEFTTTYGKEDKKSSPGWKVKDIGIGLYDQSEYDKKLIIIKRGDSWSQKELYDGGYLAGRERVFGTWIEGPHTNTYLNSFGIAQWLCKYTITYPNGTRQEFGPYGFYTPGFNTLFINTSGNNLGNWKIEYFLWNRDTQKTLLIDTREFTLTD
jgi:hypothetical protein